MTMTALDDAPSETTLVTRYSPAAIIDRMFREAEDRVYRRTDHFFFWLLLVQWAVAVLFAVVVSPRAWEGRLSHIHPHVLAALSLGAALAMFPLALIRRLPGHWVTRHVVAVSQVGFSCLFIHLTGGRIETHFHVFGSLAFLALYRDWRVLPTATVIVAADHLFRGLWFPESVYGVAYATAWRSAEHAGWVLFEDVVLIGSCLASRREMREICERQFQNQELMDDLESRVYQRTQELEAEVLERKRAEEDLRQSEDRYRSLVDNAPIGIFQMTPQGTRTLVNPRLATMLGYDSAQSYLSDHRSENAPVGADPQARFFERLSADGEVHGFEITYAKRDGSTIDTLTNARAVRDGQGEVTSYEGTVEDVTERKRAAAALEASERQLRLIIETTYDAYIAMDTRGLIVAWNRQAEKVYGWAREQALGRSLAELIIPPSYRSRHQDGIARFLDDGHNPVLNQRLELVALHREGHEIPIEITISALSWGDSFIFSSFSHDISERKRAEVELARLNQELVDASRQAGMADVATGVLHNVGNVLNSVNISTAEVRDRLENSRLSHLRKSVDLLRLHGEHLPTFLCEDPQGRSLPAFLERLTQHLEQENQGLLTEIESVTRHVEHIKQIVSMQQDYARVFGVIETCEPRVLIEDAVQLKAESLQRHRITVEREFLCDHTVTADRHKVLQILVNLLGNAKHAIQEAETETRRIVFRIVEKDPERVCISVTDTGAGITAENLPKIFRHGFTTKKNGHGFGLHNSVLAAREMNGDLTVHSDGPGRGATFTLELPRSSSNHR